jgi:signal transduction histidine kinase/ActR/RegA family two-component response regulator
MDQMATTGEFAARDTASPFTVPLALFADLTAQAILLVNPATQLVIYASARAHNLLSPAGPKADLPAPLSNLLVIDDQLTDRFRLALMTSGALNFGVTRLAAGDRISAKAQRFDFYDGPPLLLVSLQDEPELSRRFRSLSEEILALNHEIDRRREAERSLSLTTAALSRSLAIVRELAEIPTGGGKQHALATKAVAEALGGHSAAMLRRSGNHVVCAAVTGAGLSGIRVNKPLETLTPAFLSEWNEAPAACHPVLVKALGDAAGKVFAPACTCVIPFAVGGKAEGVIIAVADDPATFADISGFEIGIISEALGSLASRAEMEAQLNQSSRMEAIGQLTGGIAHDFNNLLTVVLGNAEALTDELTKLPELREMAEITANAALRGAELTSRLLAFARKQTLEPRVMDVSQLIQSMDRLLRRTLPENIAIEIVRSGGLWKTEVDPGQLEAALLNLALNARDAMTDGGSLTIEIANAALDDDYVANEPGLVAGQYVLIVVTDTGHGIPPEALQHIFQPFYTTKEVGKGTGLGLSMVYGFVKQSGGHIRVYSEVGEGTSIKLYFPRSLAQADGTALRRANDRALGGNETVLVVEDDRLVRQHVVSQLKALGYRVFEAADGKSALEILHQIPDIDLLFTDVVMPGGMGGRELSETARALRPELKVLFTSGYTENSIVHNGKLDPGVELLSKPYRREQLALKLRKVLDAK